MDLKSKILRLVQKKGSDLPTLPIVINKIISVASDKDSTIEELEKIISHDQAMVSKLIKLSNSMYYAQKTKVESIKRAIGVIGFDEIIGIALGMELLSSFKDDSGKKLNMDALWMHSIGVATASKELVKRIDSSLAKKMFLPALLHDIGKIIFSVYFKEEYIKVQRFATERKKTLYFAENSIFKLDHATLSALLMKRWNFPESIIIPCRFHHNPESAPIKYKQQAIIIHLADYLTQKARIGHSGNPVSMMIKNSIKAVGLNRLKLEMIVDQLRGQKDDIQAFFDITTEA